MQNRYYEKQMLLLLVAGVGSVIWLFSAVIPLFITVRPQAARDMLSLSGWLWFAAAMYCMSFLRTELRSKTKHSKQDSSVPSALSSFEFIWDDEAIN